MKKEKAKGKEVVKGRMEGGEGEGEERIGKGRAKGRRKERQRCEVKNRQSNTVG